MNAKEKRKRKELITTILLAVIGLVVAAAAYYFFVYNTVEAEINSIRAERAQVEDSMLSIETQVAQMRRMRAEIQAMNL